MTEEQVMKDEHDALVKALKIVAGGILLLLLAKMLFDSKALEARVLELEAQAVAPAPVPVERTTQPPSKPKLGVVR